MDTPLLNSVFLNITLVKLTEKSNSIQKSKFKSKVLHCKLEILDRLFFQNSTFHFGTILFQRFISDFFLRFINLFSKNRRAQALCACRSLEFHFRPTLGSLWVHFLFTSGSLRVHLGPIDGHLRCPIIQFFKKINFAKFADIHTGYLTSNWNFHFVWCGHMVKATPCVS